VIAAALLCGSAPALAASPTAPAPALAQAPASSTLTPAPLASPTLPAAPAVDVYYGLRGNAPIWFRDASTMEAAKLLSAILKRAPLDGLANGPELARMVETALARAQTAPFVAVPAARAASFLAEDKLISAAWVQYVRALKAPIPGMAYGDAALEPKVPTPERILIDASKAPSLLQHVQVVAAVNPIYAQLRDAAWAQMASQAQLAPAVAPDPRLVANLERARVLPASGRFILVNAATAQLWMYEDGRVQDTMKVVIGKRDTPTPALAGTIHYVTYNPYWNIPTDVAKRVVAPIVVKRGVSYLRAARYELASDWTPAATAIAPDTVDWKAVAAGNTEVHLRQLPGKNNMMGAIKFGFVNDFGIYLHDTPHKELFAKARRNFSLGCIRLEDANRLGRWLLGQEPVAPSSDPEQNVRLAKGVPVYITYLTAQPDGEKLTFADDVYGRDPKVEAPLGEVKLATAPAAATTAATAPASATAASASATTGAAAPASATAAATAPASATAAPASATATATTATPVASTTPTATASATSTDAAPTAHP
jgi:murein L,D-transpeptidase YcbB/YkuD